MLKEKKINFIKKVESLVEPKDVTPISFLGDFNKFLPKNIQDKIMIKGSKNIPYMGFIVDPYAFFLSYKIKDIEMAQSMLPKGYKLEKTSIFAGDAPDYNLITCAFSARTSAFIGIRLEFYIIARDTETGLLSWIITDYDTNTNSHDPKNGFCGYSSKNAIFAVTPDKELLVDIKRDMTNKEFNIEVDITKSRTRELNEELWLEGNLSIDYGGELLDNTSKNFSLIFDPDLMKETLEIPLDNVKITKNSYFKELIKWDKPVNAALFTSCQHFIIDQRVKKGNIKSKNDLYKNIDYFIEAEKFKTMEGDDLKKPIIKGMVVSSIFNFGLILFLMLKLLL